MKFRVTFKRIQFDGRVEEWVEQHESVAVTSLYSAKKYAKTQASRMAGNAEVIKVELLEQRVKGTT